MSKRAKKKQRMLIQSDNAVLNSDFFARDAETVARDLVGKLLVRERAGIVTRIAITETEAYLGSHDLASHAARGRTARTEVMFGSSGLFYVYLVYGLHWMLNVVAGAVGDPAAVLIRGAGPYKGPGQLTRGLDITRDLDGMVAQRSSGLWLEDVVHDKPLGLDRSSPFVADDLPAVSIRCD